MITGNMITSSTTGKMNRPNGMTILTESLLAVSSARSSRFSRISSLNTRSASAVSLPSSIDWREHHLPWLDAQWAAGHHNGADLWRRLTVLGFRGSVRVVTEWATRLRRAEKADAESLHRVPSARTIARLTTTGRDTLSKPETVTIAAIEDGVPLLVEARAVVAAFHAMIRKKTLADLDPWLERARASLVASFANGVTKDQAAVSAAITSPWSNGQTEGQITKLKLVKRQMYGRAKLDLLQARLIGGT